MIAPVRSRLAALAALAVVGCGGSDATPTPAPAPAPGSAVAPPAAAPALPGALWFVDDGPPRRLAWIAGGARHEVTTAGGDLFPSRWRLPDGRIVAIASRGDGSPDAEQLALIAPDGRVTRIGPTAPMVRDPAVDPAGAWIAFAANLDGHSDLYRLELATGAHRRLTDDPQGNFAPAVLGGALAFVSSRDGDAELYRLVGGAAERLTAFHRDDWSPTPSPDGKTIAFLSDREGPVRLFVMAADGTGQRRLTARGDDRGAGAEAEPAWSPDGTRIAYVVDRGRERAVHVRTIATGDEVIVSPAGARDGEPCWSPDGAWLAVSRLVPHDTEIWAIRLADRAAYRIASGRLPRWF